MKTQEFIDTVLAPAIERVSMDVPEDWRELFAECLTERGPSKSVRMLRNPRKGSSDRSRCLFKMLGWHMGRGNASLWGPMTAQWYADGREDFDRIDTVAQIVVVVVRGGSVACDRWAKALGVRS